MGAIYIVLLAIVSIASILVSYIYSGTGKSSVISKLIEFITTIPWYMYIPIIVAAVGISKIVEMNENIPMLMLYIYILAIIFVYILAHFITTPQNYM